MARFAQGCLLAALLLACTATVQAASYRIAHGTEPFMADDMGAAVLHEAYRRLGHSFSLEALPFERALLMANSGELDGDLIRSQPDLATQYPKLLRVTVPVASDEFVVWGIGQRLIPKGWESLKPYRIAGPRVKALLTLGPDYSITYVSNYKQGFEMLRMGRVDLVITMRGTACQPARLGFKEAQLHEPGIETVPFYHYLNTRHAALAEPLETTLRQMQKDGSLKRIQGEVRRKWENCSP